MLDFARSLSVHMRACQAKKVIMKLVMHALP